VYASFVAAARQLAQSLVPASQLAQRAGAGRTRANAAVRITAERNQHEGRTTTPTMAELSQFGGVGQAKFVREVLGPHFLHPTPERYISDGNTSQEKWGDTVSKCATCGRLIAFGGVKEGPYRFCSKRCREGSHLLAASAQIPDGFVFEKATEVHSGPCPKCGGPGPIDLHTSHTVWSAGVITQWASKPQICCHACGRSAKLQALAMSSVLGWWGLPWGIVLTPVQIIRNLGALMSSSDPSRPSDELLMFMRGHLSARMIEQDAAKKRAAETKRRLADEGLGDGD
jgi:hypothetical protein